MDKKIMENRIKQITKKRPNFEKAIKMLEEEGFSGAVINQKIGHMVFAKSNVDKLALIELIELEKELIRQRRVYTAGEMLKQEVEIQAKITNGNKKMKMDYMG